MTVASQSEAVTILNGTFCEQEEGGLSHVYRNAKGVRVPSVTQVLAFVGLVDFSRVAPDVLQHKRQIGIATHAACEYIDTPDKGELDWDSVHEEVVPYVLAYERFCEEVQFKAQAVEEAGIGTKFGMEVGYRIDRRGLVAGKYPTIVEIKCAYREEPYWPLQLAAYELFSPELPAKEPYRRVAVRLMKNGRYKVCGPYEKTTDKNKFLSCLSIAWMKLDWKYALPNVPDDAGIDEEEAA